LEQISKLDNQKYDQEFISTRDKIQHLIDLLPFDEMNRVPDDDVRFAEQRAIAQLENQLAPIHVAKLHKPAYFTFHCSKLRCTLLRCNATSGKM